LVEHHCAEAAPAKGRADIHPFDLAKVGRDEFDPGAGGWRAILAQDKERHVLGQELLYAKSMPAGRWIQRFEMGLELGDQADRVRMVGAFLGNRYCHGIPRMNGMGDSIRARAPVFIRP
jgi:hypothetical protein